jgi:hypothetical protein
MQKRYTLKLSDINNNINFGSESKSLRSIELEILETLFELAAQNETKRKDINSAFDSAQRVENLTDDEDFIFDEEDLNYIDKALELSAGKRPYAWSKAKTLFAQLAKPAELKNKGE